MVTCGRARWHTAGHGDLWQGKVACGRPTWHVAGHGDLWQGMVAHGRPRWHMADQGREDPAAMSLTGSADIDGKSEKPMSLMWGCELSSQQDFHTFQTLEEWPCQQQLALWTVSLGEAARDEFHVVEMVPVEEGDAHAPVPLATLKPSVLPTATLVGVELTPPVTFRLRAGSGPVYISGQFLTMIPDLSWEEEEEEEEEEEDAEEEEPAEESPTGQAARKGSATKKRRLEKEDELNNVSPEDPLLSKGRGADWGKKAAAKK
ncbi:nucleoplasmin-2 isoform X2 [Rissa tridactyla]|uniref:nucleoplasmin-2 isoform X2 n=1 Tax=Rissa tridactyla TaxID=75485 RepID=UPI0023BAD8D0|nr:nucleoplasmin-2 isoform X2 [Rissa tridactyla]